MYCCLNLIVGVFPIVVLIPVVADDRGNEQATETSEVHLPLLFSGFIILYIYTSVLLRFQGVFSAHTDENLPADPLLTGGILILPIVGYNRLCRLYH